MFPKWAIVNFAFAAATILLGVFTHRGAFGWIVIALFALYQVARGISQLRQYRIQKQIEASLRAAQIFYFFQLF